MPNKIFKSEKSSISWKKKEHIFLFVRRHFFSLWPAALVVFLLILMLFIFIFFFYSFNIPQLLIDFGLTVSPHKIFWTVIFMFILTMLLFLFLSWMEYYLDVTIVTNLRVIDIEQLTLFRRNTSSADLDSIQDVRAEIEGFFGSYFNFGVVYIQTAGEAPNFILRNLPNPSYVARQISNISSGHFPHKEGLKNDDNNLNGGEGDLKTHEQEFAQEMQQNQEETKSVEEKEVEVEEKELQEEEKELAKAPIIVSQKGEKITQEPKKKIAKPKLKKEENNKKVIKGKEHGEINF